KALANLNEHTYSATEVSEVKSIMENGGGFVKTMWCGNEECEVKMKELAGVSSRNIPFAQEHIADTCPVCGQKADKMVVWGIAY
ncbi:MAG: proline--tRNA ligase, partial [Oscillospiraceae bacterium]|nr:proline--tRNA ligase [Oscillospiraceae bacterium]